MPVRERGPASEGFPRVDQWGRLVDEPRGFRISATPLLVTLFAIIGGVMIAKFVVSSSIYFVIAAMLAVVLGLVVARNMEFGVITYFWIAALSFGESPGVDSPHSGYDAGLMPSEVLVIFLTIVWVMKATFGNGLKLVKSPMTKPVLCLAGASLLSMIMSNLLRGTKDQLFHQLLITQVAEVGLLWCSVFAFLMTANNLKDAKWIKRIFLPVLFLGLYFSVHQVASFDLPVPVIWGQFIVGAAIAFLLSRIFWDDLSRGKKIAFGLIAVYLMYASFSDLGWVSGWMSVGVTLLVVATYRSKALALVLVALILFVMFIYPGAYYGVATESEEGGDYDRFTIWYDAFGMFMAVDPILGIGPGNYYAYINRYASIWFAYGTYTTAHSNYVQIASEMGLLGFGILLWVIISALVTGSWASRASPPELKWLPIAASAAFAGVAAASVFGDYLLPSRGNDGIITFGTTVYSWLLMGAAVACANLPRSGEQASDIPSTAGGGSTIPSPAGGRGPG